MAETTLETKRKNRILAVILSFFISGLGHIYIGKIGLGILLLILPYSLFYIGAIFGTQMMSNWDKPVGLMLVFTSFVIWIWQIYDVYRRTRELGPMVNKNNLKVFFAPTKWKVVLALLIFLGFPPIFFKLPFQTTNFNFPLILALAPYILTLGGLPDSSLNNFLINNFWILEFTIILLSYFLSCLVVAIYDIVKKK